MAKTKEIQTVITRGQGGSAFLVGTTLFVGYLYLSGRLDAVWYAVVHGRPLPDLNVKGDTSVMSGGGGILGPEDMPGSKSPVPSMSGGGGEVPTPKPEEKLMLVLRRKNGDVISVPVTSASCILAAFWLTIKYNLNAKERADLSRQCNAIAKVSKNPSG